MMKKIIAGVAAAALAVSAMATSAFAAATEIVSVKADAPTSYTSATVTFKSVALNADLAKNDTITLSGDTAALTIVAAGAETVKINGFAETSTDEWVVVDAPALGDKTGVTAGDKALNLTVEYTFAETADTSAIKTALEAVFKADATEKLTLTLGGTAVGNVDLNFKEATIAFNAATADSALNGVSGVTLDSANDGKGLSKTQKKAITDGEVTGAEIVIELKKAVTADAGQKITVTGDINKDVTIAKGETTGTITLTATEVIDIEFADAYVKDLTFDNVALIKSATYTIFGAEAEETEGTTAADETDVTEDTTAPEDTSADDTTAAPEDTSADDTSADDTTAEGDTGADAGEGEDGENGKGDNTETGVVLAVVPAIVAGAALVVSRKRK